VFAVPGEITSTLSAGTNALLRLGATPLTSAADVLESLGLEAPPATARELGEVAASVLRLLPATADELVHTTGLSAETVAAALAELELEQLTTEGEGVYRAAR
jgi:DNA processing protein